MNYDEQLKQKDKIISKWLSNALECTQMKSDGFESIDVSELLTGQTSDFIPEQVSFAFALYKELLSQYQPYAKDYNAQLMMTLDYTDDMQIHTLDELVNNQVVLRQPPELYIVKRENELYIPVIEKEYRQVLHQNIVTVPEGEIIADYTSTFVDDCYVNSYRFRYYRQDQIEYDDDKMSIKL